MVESRPGKDDDVDAHDDETRFYPHGFKVEVEVCDPTVVKRLAAYAHWDRHSWTYLKGSIGLSRRQPRNQRKAIAAMRAYVGTGLYGVGWRPDADGRRAWVQVWGVRRTVVDRFLERMGVRASDCGARVAHREEVYAVLAPPDAHRLAASLGDGDVRIVDNKEVLLHQRLKVPRGEMLLKLYRVDRRKGATAPYRFEAAWNGTRSKRSLIGQDAAQQMCRDVLVRMLDAHGMTGIVKPSNWEPRGRYRATSFATRKIGHERARPDVARDAAHINRVDMVVENDGTMHLVSKARVLDGITDRPLDGSGDITWFGVPAVRPVPVPRWMRDGVLPELKAAHRGSVVVLEVDPNQDIADVFDQLGTAYPGAVWGHGGRQEDMEWTFRDRVSTGTSTSPETAETLFVAVGPYTDPVTFRNDVRDLVTVAEHFGKRIVIVGPYWDAVQELWTVPGGKQHATLRLRIVGNGHVERVAVLNDRVHGRHGRTVWFAGTRHPVVVTATDACQDAVVGAETRPRGRSSALPTAELVEESRQLALPTRVSSAPGEADATASVDVAVTVPSTGLRRWRCRVVAMRVPGRASTVSRWGSYPVPRDEPRPYGDGSARARGGPPVPLPGPSPPAIGGTGGGTRRARGQPLAHAVSSRSAGRGNPEGVRTFGAWRTITHGAMPATGMRYHPSAADIVATTASGRPPAASTATRRTPPAWT